MADTFCSCCEILGKPPSQINFILATGLPDSSVYERIRHSLINLRNNSCINDTNLLHYKAMMDISDHLFTSQQDASSIDQSGSKPTQNCCNGFSTMLVDILDISNSSEVDAFQKKVEKLLLDSTTDSRDDNHQSASWVLLTGSILLEVTLLNIFLRCRDANPSLTSFSLTVLCFLGNEQRLFENWLCQSQCIEQYKNKIYPEYDQQIKRFFSLLQTSQYLQENTLLIEEQTVLTDDELHKLMKCIFSGESSKYRANNGELRSRMKKLLSPRKRTVHDIRYVRNDLLGHYNGTIKRYLDPLLSALQQTQTAADAARQIVHIVINDFPRLNDEELRTYKRQMILGISGNGIKHGNSIVVKLIRYALYLLENKDDKLTPLLYGIVEVICILSTHFHFRHELFHYTPEVYKLSLLLVTQRQYTLTIAGLNLCATILDADLTEHKYATAYLSHDQLTARKILDAIKWLLVPYLNLIKLWREEVEKEQSKEEVSPE